MKLEWSATVPGTSAFNQEHNGWTAYPPGGSFHISPPSKRGGLWRVMYAAENAPVRGHHSGLWHDVGSVKTAASAKKMAGEFYSEFVHPVPWAANPTPNLEHWAQASQREHTGPRGGKSKKPSPRLVQRRLKTHHQKMPGVWANPLVNVKVKSPAQRGKAAPSGRLVARRKTTEKAPAGFYANPSQSETPGDFSQSSAKVLGRAWSDADKVAVKDFQDCSKVTFTWSDGEWLSMLFDSKAAAMKTVQRLGFVKK